MVELTVLHFDATDPHECVLCGRRDTHRVAFDHYGKSPTMRVEICEACWRPIQEHAIRRALLTLTATQFPITAEEADGWAGDLSWARHQLDEARSRTTADVALTLALRDFVERAHAIEERIRQRVDVKKGEEAAALR